MPIYMMIYFLEPIGALLVLKLQTLLVRCPDVSLGKRAFDIRTYLARYFNYFADQKENKEEGTGQ